MLEWENQNTESVQAVLDGFHGVWERVEGTQATAVPAEHGTECPPDGNASPLPELIDTAEKSAAYDRALACRCRGTSRTMLQEHAEQAAHRAAFLRGEYFIRCGKRHCPSDSCPRIGDTLDALRDGMLRDESAARAYRRAAERADDEGFRRTLERFACEAGSAAGDKRRLILRCFR